jgi:outer membrane protein assembly factor BamB
MKSFIRTSAIICVLCAASVSLGGSWAQFRGPNRDDKSNETGLLQSWPEGGPRLLWTINGLGKGFSNISIVDGKIYTMGDRAVGDPNDKKSEQFVIAVDMAAHKDAWAAKVGPAWTDPKSGPRCTPTVDGELLYAIGTSGDLVCLETATGKERWRKNFEKDFGGQMMSKWAFSESPLVDGDKVVCTPGGEEAAIVALNKKTGETLWKSKIPKLGDKGKDGAGYASIMISNACGIRQYVQMMGRGVVSVAADDGRFLWGYNNIANDVANIPNVVVDGDYIFCTTSYKTGSALLKLGKDGAVVKAEEVYFLGPDKFENHHGGVVLVDGHIYGGDGQNRGTLVCLEMKTGNIMWKVPPVGKRSAALFYADKRLYYRYEDGLMALVEATPQEFRLKGTFTPPATNKDPKWPHPVILDGKCYLRDGDMLQCYDVKAGS